MSERPIIFSAEMVRAILKGRKTQTRRVIKPQPWVDNMGNACWKDRNFGQSANHVPHIKALASPIPCSDTKRVLCPYGAPGDLLWVREGHAIVTKPAAYTWYRLDHPEARSRGPRVNVKWRPSIHMPRWASRITLRITDVRVERLQDISEDDARAEGWPGPVTETGFSIAAPLAWFANVWTSINGPGAWEANPWVWAIAFERVKP